jgi:hypothetical protein
MNIFVNLTAVIFLAFSTNICFADADELKTLIEEFEGGSKYAAYNLGVKYGSGDDVKQNHFTSNKYYEYAAKKNYAPAQNNLGWSYRQGIGLRKDSIKAIYWFRLAAIQHNTLALQNLAEMFEAGEGVKKNMSIAEDFYLLCATQRIGTGKESGSDNAIIECRKSMGKITFNKSQDKQTGLRNAALWYKVSLIDVDDLKEDSNIGVRARRVVKDTYRMIDLIDKTLTKESKAWVEKAIEDWDEIRFTLNDRADFPLLEVDCSTGNQNL